MLEKVIKEILKIRGIEHPYTYFGFDTYNEMTMFLKNKHNSWRHLSAVKRYAEILDLPIKFLVAIMRLEAIDE